jgi:tyrosine-protein phosphatase non-receptor type 9
MTDDHVNQEDVIVRCPTSEIENGHLKTMAQKILNLNLIRAEEKCTTSDSGFITSSASDIAFYSKYSHNLSQTEAGAVDEFLKIQNWSNNDARNWNIAVKFLMARRFDVERGIKLYNEHEILRKREGLDFIDLNDPEFIENLNSGKFTVLPFVKNHPVCALFTVKLHNPHSSSSSSSLNELTTLKTLIYQLDAALENPDAQRNGINFIYDMNNCKRSNYDLSLSQKILTLVRGSYPARLNKLFVVSAPFWFKCIVKVLSILMREKLRERVLFVTNDELKSQVSVEILPDHLGGSVKLNHRHWLIECNKLVTNKASTCNFYYTMNNHNNNNIENEHSIEILSNRKRQSTDSNSLEDKKPYKKQIASNNSDLTLNAIKIDPLPFNNFNESIQDVNITDAIFTIDELLDHVISTGASGLSEEFKNIRSQPIENSFEAFKQQENVYKNRYRDVLCFDETRIKLVRELNSNKTEKYDNNTPKEAADEIEEDFSENDYIHANFVDGYKQKHAYISTQGPLEDTVEDFWLMIWQESVVSIAMTTKVVESKRLKCEQYWPLERDQSFQIADLFEIKNVDVQDLGDYKITKLTIKHLPSNQTRHIVHSHFLSWPDHGVPKKASQILDFINIVRQNQLECLKQLNSSPGTKWLGHPLGPPIVVHCSAGIGRTGTFCAIDISVNRLNDCQSVNIQDTVKKIRSQRAQSVQMRDQYVFCYMALLEYAQREKLLKNSTINLDQIFDSLF